MTTMCNHERHVKLATARCVEQLIGQLSVKVCSDEDVVLLVDTIFEKDAKIYNLQEELAMTREKRRLDSQNNPVPASSLPRDWSQLFLQLRQQSFQQLHEMNTAMVEKDKIISQLKAENKNLKEIIHADNIQHLERQMSGYTSSSDFEDEEPQLHNRYIPEQINNQIMQQDDNQSPASNQTSVKVKKPVDREAAWISNMVEVTSKLAKKYAIPAHKRPEAGFRRKGKRPAIVPKVFGAIWKLLLAPPKQIFVPDPRPIVNWMKVNTHAKRNLPKPEFLPVLGVSMNPTFYETTKTMHMGIESEHNPAFERESPFGKLPGLRTSKGIMAMPEDVIHGYIWSHTEFSWVIAASPP